ncbi:SUN domain-containing protein 3-like isoform X2 [Excalfactoria chinensis]|uniref:SUN domain-containing protein 3-like isoform X2 n=1 Tax=Excalfactoria chinensis TaxID=46218 RepID=UPI003B3B4D55
MSFKETSVAPLSSSELHRYCLRHRSSPRFSSFRRQTKVWQTVALVLFTVAVVTFGVYCIGSAVEGVKTVAGMNPRLADGKLGMLSRKGERNQIQRQLNFLQWGARGITVRALHEVFRRTELPGFTSEAVQDMINQVLEKLEESPSRMPNYASKTSGAAVVHSKTSPSWSGSGKVFWKSLLVTPYMRTPEIILEPDNHPGNCWPFPGSQGHVVIKLPMAVFPTAVTINHGIPAGAYHADSISSAPKDFAVYGLKDEEDEEGIFLGEFTFVPGQAPGQTFQLKNKLSGLISYVRLQVLSNWGHPEYTCLYQFRLHGDPARDNNARGRLSG